MSLVFLPIHVDLETKSVLKKLSQANRALAELKGIITSIPKQGILLETLTLREARESSAIENIISTFDEVYQSNFWVTILPVRLQKKYTNMQQLYVKVLIL